MALVNQPSGATRASLTYITVGAVTVIWTSIWYVYLRNNPPGSSGPYYWCGGFLLTGVILVLIGLAVGQIGRASRPADVIHADIRPTVPVAAPAVMAAPVAPSAAGPQNQNAPVVVNAAGQPIATETVDVATGRIS